MEMSLELIKDMRGKVEKANSAAEELSQELRSTREMVVREVSGLTVPLRRMTAAQGVSRSTSSAEGFGRISSTMNASSKSLLHSSIPTIGTANGINGHILSAQKLNGSHHPFHLEAIDGSSSAAKSLGIPPAPTISEEGTQSLRPFVLELEDEVLELENSVLGLAIKVGLKPET